MGWRKLSAWRSLLFLGLSAACAVLRENVVQGGRKKYFYWVRKVMGRKMQALAGCGSFAGFCRVKALATAGGQQCFDKFLKGGLLAAAKRVWFLAVWQSRAALWYAAKFWQ
ncbi:hypothetical protein TNCT_480441 [Trichonephila clavata]|uniref:Secreted protein n=1 Tax=Trichonephila clavata TaxID=2740835 RepID=A0A8X6GIN1_TRICU|nr:hypothetical protein TNCT_480441 [Trichonephila clavata]